MEALWASEAEITCVHPGWPALHDREEIMSSWRRILENPQQLGIDFHEASCRNYGDMILVTCYEQIGSGFCIASNGFVVEDGQPRLVLHHASPCAAPEST